MRRGLTAVLVAALLATACSSADPVAPPPGPDVVEPAPEPDETLRGTPTAGADGLDALTQVEVDDRGCTVSPQTTPAVFDLEVRSAADLDGDGRDDAVETWAAGDAAERRRFVRVVLGTGESGAFAEEFDHYDVRHLVDLDGDGRSELIIERGGNTWITGFVGYLDGCRILGVTGPDNPDEYFWGVDVSSGACPLCVSSITCAPLDGVVTLSEAGAEPWDDETGSVSAEAIDAWTARGDDRQWQWRRRLLTYADGAFTLADEQGGTDRHADVPEDVLRNTLTC